MLRRKFFHRPTWLIIIGAMLLMAGNSVWAASCSLIGPANTVINLPATITIPSSGTPVGTPLTPWTTNGQVTYYSCNLDNNTQGVRFMYNTLLSPIAGLTVSAPDGLPTPVFPTGTPGVGVAIAVVRNGVTRAVVSNTSGCGDSGSLSYSNCNVSDGYRTYTNGQQTNNWTTAGQIYIRLIKTGTITASNVAGKPIAGGSVWGDCAINGCGFTSNLTPPGNNISFSFGSTKLINKTCTVSQPATANIGTFSVKNFTGIGSTSGFNSSGNFTINVDCTGAGVALDVKMVLTDAQNPGNTSSTLPLAPGSTASGVGIEIWRQNGSAAIHFGPDSNSVGTVNQFSLFTSASNASGPVPITFSSRYIQTGSVVTPGTADGMATFTMSYQ